MLHESLQLLHVHTYNVYTSIHVHSNIQAYMYMYNHADALYYSKICVLIGLFVCDIVPLYIVYIYMIEVYFLVNSKSVYIYF